jgi:hypothetical protein
MRMEMKLRVFVNGQMKDIKYPAAVIYRDGRWQYWSELNHECITDAIIMYSTGLQDSNGEDIYEAIS